VENSHSTKPLIYKISGVWGNHEGSMLLWVLILALFGSVVALSKNSIPARLQANTLAVQAAITIAFLLFVLMTSNPFTRVVPAPVEGQDLNPLLQDPGLAIHPPLLYIGYVGFSISFAFACAALIDGRIDAVWARIVRPWTLGAWAFLTLGIAMGSYWAYYELGWGGWWFWDPVENASLMPWLAGTALLHSTVVMEKRDALKVWTILLAILTFSLSLLGTFLVRSGVLTSVHSFAVDPERGTFILGRTYLDHLPADYLRYYFAAKLGTEQDDIDLSMEDFANRVNADLVNKAANLASRCVKFVHQRLGARLGAPAEDAAPLLERARQRLAEVPALYREFESAKALRLAMEIAEDFNLFITESAPWKLATSDPERARAICSAAVARRRLTISPGRTGSLKL